MLTNRDATLDHAVQADRQHVWHHMMQHKPFETQNPSIMVEGKGMRLWDANGTEYLDAVSGGVWTVNVGYGRASIAQAVCDQLTKLNYYAGSGGTIPAALFAEQLLEKMPGLSRVYYSNSGSEANEKVFKMVRQISAQHHNGKKWKILYRNRDYHGTTIAALSACGQAQRMQGYGPFLDGFVPVPDCLKYRRTDTSAECFAEISAKAIEDVILREGPETIGALCLEPITAGGGVITPPDGYWPRVMELCRKYDILLHIDEVVCGFGRTGEWFGYQNYDIQPDFVTMAKGVASGYAAISCTVTTEAVFEKFKAFPDDPMNVFRDISTFGGCTAGPAAAIENLAILERENLLENTRLMGSYLEQKLLELKNKHTMIGDVRGKGLFWGVELVKNRAEDKTPVSEKTVGAITANCRSQGVLIGATNRSVPGYNNTLCLSPALIATTHDLDRITDAMDKALQIFS
ncbi:aminotransferase class III-fold pyridoxal phosphate-dependent enzyme [Acetobacter persici]|uniref:aminotransferase family protein n=1 Tax=Acetobacter persici TaxID=1076596 RepID=UPI0020CDC26C|nr:aminotransferase class III-fold pyridoxal phosphate-dependent enzyme [Acetobacter persici]MCP9319131.1 aminotransferase class III-fold pyridoxal phosphate-dependent enzyme [Acetobacter persici]